MRVPDDPHNLYLSPGTIERLPEFLSFTGSAFDFDLFLAILLLWRALTAAAAGKNDEACTIGSCSPSILF